MGWLQRLALLAVASLPLSCLAADFPVRPITLIVGYAPGGGTDIFARLTAAKLSEALGQPLIVENKPGANTAIAGGFVDQAAPDGHTLLFIVNSHVTNTGTIANLGYDPIKSFKAVGLVLGAPDVLFVRPDLPVHTLAELIALAKAKPNELISASPGLGSPADLVFHLLASTVGIKVKTVQYRGSLPAINDVIAGHDDLEMSNIAETIPFVQAGKVRLIAQTGAKRSPWAPDVPTIGESGIPGLEGFKATTWFAILAPGKTPPDVVAKLNYALNAVLQEPDLQAKFKALGGEVIGGTSEEADAYMKAEQSRWLKVMADIGIVPK